MERASRSFASRKNPRYYKSYAVTPNNLQSGAQHYNVIRDSNHYGSIPVSEGLKDFNPT